MQRLVYGRRSEKLTPDETAQRVLAYGGSDENAAKADPTAVEQGKSSRVRHQGSIGIVRQHPCSPRGALDFRERDDVDPTNNHGESELRAFVLWRKRSFGTQSKRGNLFAERIMTVGHTARKQNKNVLANQSFDPLRQYLVARHLCRGRFGLLERPRRLATGVEVRQAALDLDRGDSVKARTDRQLTAANDLLLAHIACWAASALLELEPLSSRRQLLYAWRVAAAWLLALSVIVGPMGLGAALASAKTCGVSCPCDEGHASEDGDHAQDHTAQHQERGSDHHGDEHGDEDCPDDCPDCECCSWVVVAAVPMTMPSVQASYEALTVPTPPQTPAVGAPFDVYRPPRSLT